MRELIIHNMPELPFAAAEALNQLRINLGFCGDQIRTIMMTSSVPNEGKSFVTLQLWKMIAEVGTPAVLIDCDLRNSEMRRKYGIRSVRNEKLMGVPHYLAGQAEIDEVICKTNVPNGYMIPVTSAIANPTILLESPNFTRMLEYCAERFTYVLVDTPPLGSVADALNIARHCDGSVLVVHGGETPRKMVLNSVQQLKRTDTPLLGVVLNRANVDSKSNLYYHRYYKSGYYYKNYGNHSQTKK